MLSSMTPTACVMAALYLSPLLARQEVYFRYRDDPKDAVPGCSASSAATPPEEAFKYGVQALKNGDGVQSTCWLRIAAAKGNPSAEGALAMLLGTAVAGAPFNPVEAHENAVKSVQAHNCMGEIAMGIDIVRGVPATAASEEDRLDSAKRDCAKATPVEREFAGALDAGLDKTAADKPGAKEQPKTAENQTQRPALAAPVGEPYWKTNPIDLTEGLPREKPAGTQSVIPHRLSQCEGDRVKTHCDGTWEFSGSTGSAVWTSGTAATLSVTRFDREGVEIRRTDTSGRAAGLTAVYTGTFQGDRIAGSVTWTWPGHWNNQPQSGTWSAKVLEPANYAAMNTPHSAADPQPERKRAGSARGGSGLPQEMRFCGQHCISLVLQGGQYVNAEPDPRAPNWKSVWVVEKFTPESVVLIRTDTNNGRRVFGGTYTGRIAPEGDHLLDVRGDGVAGNLRIAWGAALATLPANDNELRAEGGNPDGVNPMAPQMGGGNPMMGLWAMLFAIGAQDNGGMSDGLTGRITALQNAVDTASHQCSSISTRRTESECEKWQSLKYKLADAWADMHAEIAELQEAHGKLDPQCKAGDQDACQKLDKVDALLKKDQAFNFQQIF